MCLKSSNINNINSLLTECIIEEDLIVLLSDLKQKKDNRMYERIIRLKSLIDDFNPNNS